MLVRRKRFWKWKWSKGKAPLALKVAGDGNVGGFLPGRRQGAGLVPAGEGPRGSPLASGPSLEVSPPKTCWENAPKIPRLCRLLKEQLVGTFPRSCQTSAWLRRSAAGGETSVVREATSHTFLIRWMLLVRRCC